MPRKIDPIFLSRLNAGINRYAAEAQEHQVVDGENVYEDDGDVRRRPAFKAVVASTPFYKPAGLGFVITEEIGVGYTNHTDRQFSVTAGQIGGTTHNVYFGCDDTFDGIEFRHLTSLFTNPTAHRRLTPKYWNGTEWADIPAVIDHTIGRIVDGSDDIWYQSLTRDGRVSWHSGQMSDWAARAVNSVTKYWIRLDIDGGALTGSGSLTLGAPGIIAFTLEAVNGIIPLRGTNGANVIVICSDRKGQSHLEQGAQVGFWHSRWKEVQDALVVHDWGAGAIGAATFDNVYEHGTWTGASSQRVWPGGGAWADTGAGSGSFGDGTNKRVTKLDERYEWTTDTNRQQDQWRGSAIQWGRSPVTNGSNDATLDRSSLPITSLTGDNAGRFVGCRMRGVTGVNVGEEREIIIHTVTSMTVYPAFSSAPLSTDTYDIFKPHSKVRFVESEQPWFEVNYNEEHMIELKDGTDFAPDVDIDNTVVHFEVGQLMPWVAHRGREWSATFEPITRQVLMVNGYNVFTYDGKRFEELEAISDPDNLVMRAWVGGLDDTAKEVLRTTTIAGSTIRKNPPTGRFIADFFGSIVVADRNLLRWSASGVFNNIWPYAYETQIRDRENPNITGMWVLNDQLVVSTVSSLWTADPPEPGRLISVNPAAQGIGFTSSKSVDMWSRGGSSMLIGAAADSIYTYDGASITPLVDAWDRWLPGGVNAGRLHEAAGAVSLHRGEYYLAVAAAGYDYNSHMIVYNIESQKAWVWECPFGGITAIARDYDDIGNERMLFGTADGHVCVLHEADTDDGSEITGRARMPAKHLMGSTTFAATGLMMVVKDTGPVKTLTVKTFMNEKGTESQSVDKTFDQGSDAFDSTEVYGPATGTNVAAVFANDGWKTRQIRLPEGTVGESLAVEVSGSNQWKLRGISAIIHGKGQRSGDSNS